MIETYHQIHYLQFKDSYAMTPEDISCELKTEIKDRLNKLCAAINCEEKLNYYEVPQCHLDWVVLNIPFPQGMRHFVVAPSVKFKRVFFNRQYIKSVAENPELFGTGNAEDVLLALKKTDSAIFPPDYTLVQFNEYMKHENMAYVMEITDGKLRANILRIDLYRGIKNDNDFNMGLFHSLKHFTLEEYRSISKDVGGHELAFWELILLIIAKNFFYGPVEDKEKGRWTSVHEYDGKFAVGGYVPKRGVDNLYLFNTMIVKRRNKLSPFEKTILEDKQRSKQV